MNDNVAFDRFVADQFAQVGSVTPPEHSIDDIVTQARRLRPLPRWLATIKEPPMRISSRVAVGSPMARITALVILMLTLSVLTAGGVVVGASLLPSPAPAAACATGPGRFEPLAQHMVVPRFLATAVQLSDGRVLIVGGYDAQEDPVAVAELYEPATGTSRSVGTSAIPQIGPAVLLQEDRVLVLPVRSTTPAEVWDPTTATLAPTGSLAHPRGDYTATRLQDGSVLIAGGGDDELGPNQELELYDPRTGEFSPAGSFGDFGPSGATLLEDGHVLFVGLHATGEPAAMTWDPANGSLTPTGAPMVARASRGAVRLADGKVLLVGGLDTSVSQYPPGIAEAELYDPVPRTFSPAGKLAAGRSSEHSVTLLADGKVLVIGGWMAGWAGTPVAEAEIWDPATLTFTPAGTLAHARAEHAAALLPDCSVLVMGGTAEQPNIVANERWIPGP